MAVAQYIGARYVPIFYTNPDDNSNNWKSGVVYDPLTIVTDLTQSYTSKIPVPASVGRPSENPDYWILTGAYNAQVEQYRQDVAQYAAEVEEYKEETTEALVKIDSSSPLLGGKTVVYGDSTTTVAGNYVQALIDDYGLDITNRGVSGTILTDGIALINSAVDLDTYDNIILAYGTNHWQGDLTLQWNESAYENAFSAILTKNPNITIICITPFWSYHKFGNNPANVNNRGYTLQDYVESTKKICAKYGVRVIDFYTTSGCNKNNYTSLLVPSFSDPSVYVHEGAAFGAKLAELILNNNYSDAAFTPNRRNYFNCLSFGAALMQFASLSNIPSEGRGGLCFAFNASTDYDSSAQYLKAKTYILSGCSSAAGTVSLLKGYDKTVLASYSIQAGFFSIPLEPDTTTVYFIRFNMAATAYIGNVELFSADNDYSTANLYNRGDAGFQINAENVRAGAQPPTILADGYVVHWSDGHFTANRTLTSGSVLFTSGSIYFPIRFVFPANIVFTDNNNDNYTVLLSFYQNQITLAEGTINNAQMCRILGGSHIIPLTY